MNSQDVCNLQEAYLEVYEEKTKEYQDVSKKVFNTKEEVDLYDIILSHLIDEGYANTNESALVIMTNMSEGWAQSIIEQKTDPLKTSAEMSNLRNTAFGSETFQKKIWLSPSNPKGPNWDPKSVKTPGV
jgi:hypothetical protein